MLKSKKNISKTLAFVLILLLVFFGFSKNSIAQCPTPDYYYTVSTSNPAAPALDKSPGDSKIIIYKIYLSPYNTPPYVGVVNGLSFSTLGSYNSLDILSYELWFNTVDVFPVVPTVTDMIGPFNPGSYTFPAFSVALDGTNGGYFWITMDLAPTADPCDTIKVDAITIGSVAYSCATHYTYSCAISFVSYVGGRILVLPCALPIELSSFNATCTRGISKIEWSTSSESNNDFFTVEKSSNAKDWEILGKLDGAGNSNELINYSFNDNNPFDGKTYYRLKQTDLDGSSKYFDPISVTCDEVNTSNNLILSANYVSNEINCAVFSNEETGSTIEIYNSYGQIIYSKKYNLSKGTNNINLDISKYNSGSFYVTVRPFNQNITNTKPFIIP